MLPGGTYGDESRPRTAKRLGLFHVLGHFDDAPVDWLDPIVIRREVQIADDSSLRHLVGFDHANPRRPADGGEVVGRLFHLFVGHRLGEVNHRDRIRLARIGRAPQTVAKILELAHEVRHRQPGGRRILRPAFAIGQMTRSAAARRVARTSSRTALDDRRHRRRMILREPVDHVVAVADVDERVGRRGSLLPGAVWSARPDLRWA
jgi:hypothetical protein